MKRVVHENRFNEIVRIAEMSLGLDLNCLSLKWSPAAVLGGLAKTINTKITLSHEAVTLPAAVFEFIVAHELVHVAQKLRAPL